MIGGWSLRPSSAFVPRTKYEGYTFWSFSDVCFEARGTGISCWPTLLLSAYAVNASAIYGVNHTHWAINRFSVDGRSAVDSIGPNQGGGGGCCYTVPDQWRPGVMVRVDWETGVGGSKGFLDLQMSRNTTHGCNKSRHKSVTTANRHRPGLHQPECLRHHCTFPALR